MNAEDEKILDAVMGVVTRYGIKRATMDELARHAGVSRQTLYDRYGDKDGVMAAAIQLMVARIETALQAAFARAADPAEMIDAYFATCVVPIFEAMQQMPDAADLEKGFGPKSMDVSADGARRKQAMLADAIGPHLAPGGPTPQDFGAFFEQSCTRAKMSAIPRAELDRFLGVLKASAMALCHPPAGAPHR